MTIYNNDYEEINVSVWLWVSSSTGYPLVSCMYRIKPGKIKAVPLNIWGLGGWWNSNAGVESIWLLQWDKLKLLWEKEEPTKFNYGGGGGAIKYPNGKALCYSSKPPLKWILVCYTSVLSEHRLITPCIISQGLGSQNC